MPPPPVRSAPAPAPVSNSEEGTVTLPTQISLTSISPACKWLLTEGEVNVIRHIRQMFPAVKQAEPGDVGEAEIAAEWKKEETATWCNATELQLECLSDIITLIGKRFKKKHQSNLAPKVKRQEIHQLIHFFFYTLWLCPVVHNWFSAWIFSSSLYRCWDISLYSEYLKPFLLTN